MTFADGLELANGALAFAEHQNVELMAARGNQRISGVGVIAQVSPNMTVNVAAGNVLAGGVVVAVNASATFAGIVAGGNVLFSTLQASLTSGQAVFVFIHVDSSGVITNTDGTPAVAGQQLPPDVPEDELVLAMLTLTQGDTTIDNVDIEDWRVNVPKGAYIAGELTITTPLTNGNIDVGIGDNKIVEIDSASVANGEYAKFTANGLESRTFAQVLADIAAAPIADPIFTGEIGIGAVNVSETELGILEGATITTVELNVLDDHEVIPILVVVDLGASLINYFGLPAVLLPNGANDCRGTWSFVLPTGWDTTVTIVIWFAGNTSGADTYNGLWTVSAIESGEDVQTKEGNVLNASGAHDFPGAGLTDLTQHTIALNNANIVGGKILSVEFQADTMNSVDCNIAKMVIIKT